MSGTGIWAMCREWRKRCMRRSPQTMPYTGDIDAHIHFHVVPKYKGCKMWGWAFADRSIVSNKNHYLRWKGDAAYYRWCERAGEGRDKGTKGFSRARIIHSRRSVSLLIITVRWMYFRCRRWLGICRCLSAEQSKKRSRCLIGSRM